MVSADHYLGFDFGEKRIGVAIGQRLTRTANPLTTLSARDGQPDWQALALLIDEWQPRALIVGLPVHMDGAETPMTEKAKRFARRLHGRFGLPVHHCDERLSSAEANDRIKSRRQEGARGKTQRGDDDRIAAALILQQWLEMCDANS